MEVVQKFDNPYIIPEYKRTTFFHKLNQMADAVSVPTLALSTLPIAEQQTVDAYLEQNRQLFLYFHRLMRITVYAAEKARMAILLFSPGGILMECSGSKAAIESLEKDGIRKHAVWMKEILGANALTMGLYHQKGIFSVGDENYNQALKKYAMYYSPLTHNSLAEPSEMVNNGGLIIMVPAEDHNIDYLSYVYNIAHDLMTNTYFSYTVNAFYNDMPQGIMQFDCAFERGHPYVTYCNRRALDMLGIPDEDINFKSAYEYFAPPPDNIALWEIVNQRKRVKDLEINVTVFGRTVSCILSTRPFYQPRLGPDGMLFFFTTPQQISEDVSSQVGNNAILSFDNIVGHSSQIMATIQKAKQISRIFGNVMLLGESGVGKDVFAQAIHNGSSRRGKPFIAVNCGALPRELIASELFGYDSGAFTGAKKKGNIGKFELANGGTIFLDEIGELPLDLQATLLRVVEEKRLMRLGSNRSINVDVRIICATNANLPEMIRQKRFREDLYFRLGAIQLHIPPLRERGEDVVELAEHFINRVAMRTGRGRVPELAYQSKLLLQRLPWTGNVRELQNLMECIVQLYNNSVIIPEQIMENISAVGLVQESYTPMTRPVAAVTPAAGSIRHVVLTADTIREALVMCGNNKCAAARYLGVSIRTLYRKMEKLGVPLDGSD